MAYTHTYMLEHAEHRANSLMKLYYIYYNKRVKIAAGRNMCRSYFRILKQNKYLKQYMQIIMSFKIVI